MKDNYDVIVVGGGPVGSTAARLAAEGGVKVLLLEKDREIGIPVRCGEAVGEKGIKKIVDLKDEWIANHIKALRLVAPDGTIVKIHHEDVGFILDRKRFDYDLAMEAASAGVDVLTKAYVYDLLTDNGTVTGVKVRHLGKQYNISSKVVIGADGVESRVGRWAGLKTNLKLKDVETCVQMTVTNINIKRDYCDFYFSKKIAPGGYLWVFPKNENTANIGLGIAGDKAQKKSPLAYLNEFMKAKFPEASILTTVAGGVPIAPYTENIVSNGLMLTGDAARQSNPISGGGIVLGMLAAQIAGRIAAEAVKENNVSEQKLLQYVKGWEKIGGNNHRRAYRLKETVFKLTDDDLNKTAEAINKKSAEKHTIVNIFKTALMKHPKLITDILKVFWG
jgi:digeranylgeranylglycerophospholipid reductase